jgi:AcrR family transcriptional regulator
MQDILEKRRHSERMERRDRILGAAKTVFLQKGYFKTNIRDIAKAATLSPGAIYYYFGGIDEIYAEICEGSFQMINQFLERECKKKLSPLKKLENMSNSFSRFYVEHPEYFDLFAFSDLGWKRVGLKEELASRLDQALKKAISIVQTVIEEGIRKGEMNNLGDSRQISYALWSGIEGALSINRRGLLENADFEIAELIKTQMRMTLKGLASSP